MTAQLSRRTFLSLAAASLGAAPRPMGVLIDTHIHMFARDRKRWPLHANSPYDPDIRDLEDYRKFIAESRIDHSIIVHPEPYQDNHEYLEYCFDHEPSPGFFKGTCLLDPVLDETPGRMATMKKKFGQRLVAIRIHAMNRPAVPPLKEGPIKNRDLRDPRIKRVWRTALDLGMAVQMHFLPHHAPEIAALAAEFRDLPVILDHLARAGMGTTADFQEVLKLAKFPRVYMKYSAVKYSSKTDYPFADAKPIVRQSYDAFGPDRMIWGALGYNMPDFEQNVRLFDEMFDFAPEADRVKIRGLTAQKLFEF
jgi:predicted TIM-barrel fold metal-dependent hydrolase